MDRAKSLYDFYDIKNSITKGRSQLYGAVGEVVAVEYLKERGAIVEHSPCKDYDVIANGMKIDVKTKRCTSAPLSHYFCSIATTSLHQETDYYLFVRVLEDFTSCFILGFIQKMEMLQKGVFYKKGDPDPSSGGRFLFKEDCYNIPVSGLYLK